MHIGVYGSGYLATVISACLADFGSPVCCCHSDSSRITSVAKGDIPFYEKNLQEVIRRNVRSGRLIYSTDPEDLARRAQVIFLAEDSPQGLEELVVRMGRAAGRMQVLSVVTPVRVGTTSILEKALKAQALRSILVCQPMFFTNGCAVEDFNWPDRIILGTSSSEAVSALKQIFHPLVMRGVPVLVTNFETAELAREATTAFVATKISFINEIASLCEHVRADAVSLSLALGLDKKIAPRCLQPGAGMDTKLSGFMQFRYQDSHVRAGNVLFPRRQFAWFARMSPSRRVQNVGVDGFLGQEADFANVRLGRGGNVNLNATVNATDHLVFDLIANTTWLHVDDSDGVSRPLFTARVERLRANYTFTARSFVRLIGQYVSTDRDSALFMNPPPAHDGFFSGSVLFAYKINWQSVMFFGYGDDRALDDQRRLQKFDRQIFVKLSYAFQK